jgi:hypothetical protein
MKTFSVLVGLWVVVYVATSPLLLGGILRPKSVGTFGSASKTPIITVNGANPEVMSADQFGPVGTLVGTLSSDGMPVTIVGDVGGEPRQGEELMPTDAGWAWRGQALMPMPTPDYVRHEHQLWRDTDAGLDCLSDTTITCRSAR